MNKKSNNVRQDLAYLKVYDLEDDKKCAIYINN